MQIITHLFTFNVQKYVHPPVSEVHAGSLRVSVFHLTYPTATLLQLLTYLKHLRQDGFLVATDDVDAAQCMLGLFWCSRLSQVGQHWYHTPVGRRQIIQLFSPPTTYPYGMTAIAPKEMRHRYTGAVGIFFFFFF